jgi:spermidine synthase
MLIFSFQVFYGYLYHIIGILISVFMAGIAAGSILMNRSLNRIKHALRVFINVEAAIVIFTFLAAGMLTRLSGWYLGLFFISGFLMGLEFPLASKIYLADQNNIGATAGSLYSADLLGGWVAGILGGVVFLPILGLFNTCMVIVFIKLSSLLLLIFPRQNLN